LGLQEQLNAAQTPVRHYGRCCPEDVQLMYVISLDRYLDGKGTIAIRRAPARKIANFATAAVSYASNQRWLTDAERPVCFECRKPGNSDVDIRLTPDDLVVWRCKACGCEGQISNWRRTFWDLSSGIPSR
jgi:hypothetical protein